MNRKKRPNIFLIFILIILLLIIGNSILSGQDKAQTLTLEQLLTKIENFQVADVSITPNNGVYIVSGKTVTTQQGEKLNQQRHETFNQQQDKLAKKQELAELEVSCIAGKSYEEQQAYMQQLEKEVNPSKGLSDLFSRQGQVLQGSVSLGAKPFQTTVITQEYQIKQVTDALEAQGISYNTYPYKAPFDWVGLIFQVGSFLILGFFIFNMVRGKTPGVDNKDISPKKTNIFFKDVIGYEEEKQELSELVDFLKHPQKYKAMGAKLPRGVLLEGPPGTGKTLMAKAVAGESNVPFFAVSGSDFEEMYVGLGASRIRKVFKEARKAAPAVLFIDEIDAIGKRDVSKNSNPAQNQTINSLLVEMDGFDSDDANIIVMAATNKKDNLDDALLRPGRFDRQILVDLPPVKTREAILRYHLANKKVKDNIDYASLARSTTGMSGAQLAAVANEGALLAVRERKELINQEMLQESIDRVLMGPAKITNKYSHHDKQVVSYHESGHCIVGLELEGAMEVQKITIIPRRDAGGYVSYIPSEEEERFTTKQQLLDRLTSLLAGRCSEEVFIGDVTVGAYNDFEQATNIARAMVTKYGMSDLGVYQYEANGAENLYANKQYSEVTATRIDDAIEALLKTAKARAQEILMRRADDIHLLAKTIREREVLDKEQIDYLIKHRELPEDIDSIYDQVEPTSEEAKDEITTKQMQDTVIETSSNEVNNEPSGDVKERRWPRNQGNSDANDFM